MPATRMEALLEALVIERVIGLFAGVGIEADVVEGVLAESIKGDTLHEARGDDTVGVDVGAGDGDGGPGNLCDGCDGHGGNWFKRLNFP